MQPMRFLALADRNFKVMWRDWLSLGLNVALPVAMLVVMKALEGVDDFFAPTSLAPGIVLFGFAMLTMTSAMALAQDRESSLFDRLLTTPLRANDFVLAYSLPFVAVAVIQAVLVIGVGLLLGFRRLGSLQGRDRPLDRRPPAHDLWRHVDESRRHRRPVPGGGRRVPVRPCARGDPGCAARRRRVR